jgi:hypothetical protein
MLDKPLFFKFTKLPSIASGDNRQNGDIVGAIHFLADDGL